MLADKQITEFYSDMITPFVDHQVKEENGRRVISYGLSSYGYDVRCSKEFKIFTNIKTIVTDPKNFALESLVSQKGDVCVIPPNSYALAVTIEYFKMPVNVVGLVTVKSTYARTGIVTPTTVLEPGWEGFLTLEIANNSPLPAFIYANEGIAQIIFFKGDVPCGVSYADRKGKYQGQTGVTPAIV